MTLIVGGAGQGKLAYALSCLHADITQVSRDPARPAPIIANLEEWHLTHDGDELDAILKSHPDVVLLCREVGCGVCPTDPADRAWREKVGRVCCSLAGRASCVVRLCCGIPVILKGTPPWN